MPNALSTRLSAMLPSDALLRSKIRCLGFGLIVASLVMTGLFVTVMAVTPWEYRRRYSALFIIPLGCTVIVGTIALVFDRQPAQQVEPARIRERKCLWASQTFEGIDANRPELHCVCVKCVEDSAEWVVSKQPSKSRASCAHCAKTCSCCLEDFVPDSHVAILPCGHVFHESAGDPLRRWEYMSDRSGLSRLVDHGSGPALSEDSLNAAGASREDFWELVQLWQGYWDRRGVALRQQHDRDMLAACRMFRSGFRLKFLIKEKLVPCRLGSLGLKPASFLWQMG
ncbi:unnamed protein product [Symbiodinium microadriaticum]|nr:unnamed protein product [Symbiodinium microadriaticum]